MFSKSQAKNKRKDKEAEAHKKKQLAESRKSAPFLDLEMRFCSHSLVTSFLKKQKASVVALTTDGLFFYCDKAQKKGSVIRASLTYKNSNLGEAVYYVVEATAKEGGIYIVEAELLPMATTALETTVGHGALGRLAFMLGSDQAYKATA
jgi:hypothetical protein